MFPIKRTKDNDDILMELIRSEGNFLELGYKGDDRDDEAVNKPFHQFYITETEFGDNADNLCKVSQNSIKIYDN